MPKQPALTAPEEGGMKHPHVIMLDALAKIANYPAVFAGEMTLVEIAVQAIEDLRKFYSDLEKQQRSAS